MDTVISKPLRLEKNCTPRGFREGCPWTGPEGNERAMTLSSSRRFLLAYLLQELHKGSDKCADLFCIQKYKLTSTLPLFSKERKRREKFKPERTLLTDAELSFLYKMVLDRYGNTCDLSLVKQDLRHCIVVCISMGLLVIAYL